MRLTGARLTCTVRQAFARASYRQRRLVVLLALCLTAEAIIVATITLSMLTRAMGLDWGQG